MDQDTSSVDTPTEPCVFKNFFTSPEVASGLDSKNNATEPATTGDAADVPLKYRSTKLELYLA